MMMFRGRREYINFTHSTAYTILFVATANTTLHILYSNYNICSTLCKIGILSPTFDGR